MKHFFKLFIVIFFIGFTAQAQDFITHKVKDNETVKDLAKTYGVTASQILDLNPDASKDLKFGSVLIIPNVKSGDTTVTQTVDSFKEHKVKRKETLYSISKLYNVSIPDLKKYNKFLYANPLRKGDKLQIPNITKEATEVVVGTPVTTEVEEVKEVKEIVETAEVVKDSIKPNPTDVVETAKTYIVKKSEGKWRIAQNLGITVEELEKSNPQIANGLKEGDTLRIPVKNIKTPVEVAPKTYSVLASEGFFRVKLKTGLTQEQLEELNPGLKETGLKPGMVLNIGTKGGQQPQDYVIATETGSLNLLPSLNKEDQKKLAILLPFKLKSIELDSVSATNKRLQSDKLLNISLDFYSGVEIALDSLKKLNIPLDVKVYDTNNRESNSMTIANELAENNTNAVIGPLLPKNFNTVASKLAYDSIPMFSPLTKKVKVGANVFQSRPSEDLLFQRVVNYVKRDSTANIVILHDSKNSKRAKQLKAKFPNAQVLASKLDKKGKEQFYIYEVTLAKTLKPGNNVVFLETRAEGFVSNVSSVLNSKNNLSTMNIILATTNMNEAFEGDNVSNNQLSNLQFMYPTMAKMASGKSNKNFVKTYKKLYNETPSSYAVRGFDLTMDVVLRLMSTSDIYNAERNKMLTEYLQNKFMYVKSPQGGFINNALYLVKYKDLNIVEIND